MLADDMENIPPSGPIFHIKTPTVPQFRFEWHSNRKVYLIRVGATPEIGELLATDIADAGAAHTAVALFLRGYRVAKGERWDDAGKLIRKDMPNDHQAHGTPAS